DQSLLVAAAEEQSENRDLSEHVVQAVHRHEGAAHAHLVAGIVDRALDGGADHRALDHAVADGERAVLPGELGAQRAEGDAVAGAVGSAGSYALELRLALDRE